MFFGRFLFLQGLQDLVGLNPSRNSAGLSAISFAMQKDAAAIPNALNSAEYNKTAVMFSLPFVAVLLHKEKRHRLQKHLKNPYRHTWEAWLSRLQFSAGKG